MKFMFLKLCYVSYNVSENSDELTPDQPPPPKKKISLAALCFISLSIIILKFFNLFRKPIPPVCCDDAYLGINILNLDDRLFLFIVLFSLLFSLLFHLISIYHHSSFLLPTAFISPAQCETSVVFFCVFACACSSVLRSCHEANCDSTAQNRDQPIN